MKTKDYILIVAGTFLIIVGAYVSVPIGPVPIILTNFFIILVGLILGWKRGLVAVLIYILLGALGFPLFSNGRGGLGVLFGLTGGFIFGYIPLVFLSGLVTSKKIPLQLIIIITGSLILYIIGVPWAINIYNTTIAPSKNSSLWNMATALKYTVFPFFIPDFIKIVVAIGISRLILPTITPFINDRDD